MPTPLNALTSSFRSAPGRAEEEIRLPIFEQLQSEWFRRRTPARSVPPPGDRPGKVPPAAVAPPPTPIHRQPAPPPPPSPMRPPAPAARPPAAAVPPPMPQQPPMQPMQPVHSAQPQPVPGHPGDSESWQSPADEGWRAAERLLAPTTGGTTRAGLPMRVPQAHLMPGAADTPPAPPPVPSATARSPEAVRSRLASYHQGVRRGRHADRRGDNADQPEVLVQTQEQT